MRVQTLEERGGVGQRGTRGNDSDVCCCGRRGCRLLLLLLLLLVLRAFSRVRCGAKSLHPCTDAGSWTDHCFCPVASGSGLRAWSDWPPCGVLWFWSGLSERWAGLRIGRGIDEPSGEARGSDRSDGRAEGDATESERKR